MEITIKDVVIDGLFCTDCPVVTKCNLQCNTVEERKTREKKVDAGADKMEASEKLSRFVRL